MNSEIARERMAAVLRPDTITVSQGDFLGTHVAVRRLKLPGKFETVPSGGREYTEEYVYKKFVRNPENRHQFIAVYGQSGTGKSHLIRWFEAKYRAEKPENEVVLFIRRSDNTLKGTIRQLLSKEEVQSIENRDLYERLVKTSSVTDEGSLKGRIYYEFVNSVENDQDSHEIRLTKVNRDRLASFLKNDLVRQRLMKPDGPFERIYSKVAEHTFVDRDTIAEFREEDFQIPVEFGDRVINAGADRRAENYIKKLMSDEEGKEFAKKTADYLNQFVNGVIQQCAGIMPGDFRDIFLDIRKGLSRQNKNLTLFIEDITSFTGVDDALLDALMVEHTGMDGGENLCRISSFVGTTSGYLENNFRDNHRDRITQYVYIPSDLFDAEGVLELAGRYLNAISLPEEAFSVWAENRSEEAEYPVHQATEGARWDFKEIAYGKKLCLYPFTRSAVLYLYQNQIPEGKRTPRYVIREIIEPAVSEILLDKKSFPGKKFREKATDTKLNRLISSQITDSDEADRLRRFLTIWGDGSGAETEHDGIVYVSGVRREILDELGFPPVALQKGEYVPPEDKPPAPQPAAETGLKQAAVSELARERVRGAEQALQNWREGGKIDLSSTSGVSGSLRVAQEEIHSYLYSVIDWLAEGISQDNMTKIKNSSVRLATIANQTKSNVSGFYVMPADTESADVIASFVKYREYGKNSWNYPGAEEDVYTVVRWTEKIRGTLTEAVRDTVYSGTSYIEAALVSEVYRQILRGEFSEASSQKMQELLLQKIPASSRSAASGHSEAWKKLLDFMEQDGREEKNKKTVRQYFDLPQGEGGSLLVLNHREFDGTVRKVRKSNYEVTWETEAKDPVKDRQEVFSYYSELRRRMETAAEAEQKKAAPVLARILDSFDGEDIEEEDLKVLAEEAEEFYKAVSDAGMNITYYDAGSVLKSSARIAKAVRDIEKGAEETNTVEILRSFSADPLLTVDPLLKLLDRLEKDFEKADREISLRKQKLEAAEGNSETALAVMDPKRWIELCAEVLGIEVAE